MTGHRVETPRAKVTVGIPFLNPGMALVEAVRSVFSQTFQDWALVLLDDGSTDGSLERARAITDPRVVVVADGQHRGLVHRLNELARMARGPLLARMDADDLMHPLRLEREVSLLEAKPAVQVVGTAAYLVDGEGRLLGRWDALPLPKTVGEVLVATNLFIHPTVVFRTEFARAHPYDPAYPRAEDLALWCRIVEIAKCDAIDDPLLFYRIPLPFNLRNYVGTKRSTRALLRSLQGSLEPRLRRKVLWTSHWTEWAYRLAGLVGAHERLVRRRGRLISDADRAEAGRALESIHRARVAGWD